MLKTVAGHVLAFCAAMLSTVGLWALTAGWAQGPAPVAAPPTVPEWIARYAGNQEQARRQCDILLAQEQDKTEKLVRELAETKQALARATAKPESTPKPGDK